MKLLPALLCAAIIALVTPACATKKDTSSCCAEKSSSMKGSCDVHMKKHKN